ncbi:Fatty acyl-CoA elongase/Polyunsaturated fatty acid specific elongation enzyme [Hypoxylon texense]
MRFLIFLIALLLPSSAHCLGMQRRKCTLHPAAGSRSPLAPGDKSTDVHVGRRDESARRPGYGQCLADYSGDKCAKSKGEAEGAAFKRNEFRQIIYSIALFALFVLFYYFFINLYQSS